MFESLLVHVVSRQLAHYYRAVEWAKTYLGGVCVKCGTTENLEFDHIDSTTKTCNITPMLRSKAKQYWKEELDKCQLLCRPHRWEKKVANGETGGGHNKIVNPRHGTAVMYAAPCRCRCDDCRAWKSKYRAGTVDAQGRPRNSLAAVARDD